MLLYNQAFQPQVSSLFFSIKQFPCRIKRFALPTASDLSNLTKKLSTVGCKRMVDRASQVAPKSRLAKPQY
jgi:hypothetical protein